MALEALGFVDQADTSPTRTKCVSAGFRLVDKWEAQGSSPAGRKLLEIVVQTRREPSRRALEPFEILGGEDCHQGRSMTSNDARELAVGVAENILRRIVAMKRAERDRQTFLTLPPIGPLREQAVCDVAESAVPHAESCPDPVRDFTDDRRVGVVHTDELRDVIQHESIVGSIAEKAPAHGEIAFSSTGPTGST